MIKHSVIMITYNQENFIIDALKSIFTQDILPYEVIIGDDCSADNTRSVIAEYQNKYPSIIKPIFNEENMGIYKNLNNIKEYGVSGDVVSLLSGDDLFKNNMFSAFNKIIEENNLQPKEESFLILSNLLYLLPNGDEGTAIDNFKLKGKNYFKLRIRNRISSRYTGISRKLFDILPKWDLDIGLWADYHHSVDLYAHCDKFYFINQDFPVYRLGSGVTSKEKKENLVKSYIKAIRSVQLKYDYKLDVKDKIFLNHEVCLNKTILDKTIGNIFIYLVFHFLVIFDNGNLKVWLFNFCVVFPQNVQNIVKRLIKKSFGGKII